MKTKKHSGFIICIILTFFSAVLQLHAQTGVTFKGVILEKGTNKPVEGASISLPQYELWAVADQSGNFILNKINKGKTRIVIQSLGMVTIDQDVLIEGSDVQRFFLEPNTLRLKDVEVTAKERREGATPITTISRSAIDHIQATSLADVLNLLPGAVPGNQSLGSAQTANLRTYMDALVNGKDAIKNVMAMNSMGTSIIVDNAPISNNANMQVLNTSTNNNLTYNTTAGDGLDIRQISADNIESVDVIKGIASVQYGDVSSGAIIIRSKAGKSPLQVRFKMNPNIVQTSASGGYKLGEKTGSLNLTLDYAHSLNDQRYANKSYDRYNAKFLYSNVFFKKLRTNTSLDIIYTKDNFKQDLDDEVYQTMESSDSKGIRLNTNGVLLLNKDWLKSISYTLSGDYTQRKSYRQTIRSNSEAILSNAMSDGSIVSNKPGEAIFDAEGNPITIFNGDDVNAYTYLTPNSYLSQYWIDGKEWGTFANVRANLSKDLGDLNFVKIIAGADYKGEGNNGDGKTYNQQTPPGIGSGDGRALRMRSYKDIPALHQLGLYVEETTILNLGGHKFETQTGLRFDKQKGVREELNLRFNASLEAVKDMVFLRGGYGTITKSVPMLYLYPDKAYYDLLNYTNKTTAPKEDYFHIMTTRVFDTGNKNLKMAKNRKAELGFDFNLKKVALSVTAYQEKMDNGFGFITQYTPVQYNKYIMNSSNQLELDPANSKEYYLTYSRPTNKMYIENKGIDFDINLGRIDAIRTSFAANGGYLYSKSYENDEEYYVYNGVYSNYVGIYEAGNTKYKRERFATTLRAIHNIPELGFVISVSAVTTWVNKDKPIIG
ncbi:MAG: carboxypeptidase-like regulatory domain-containing protein, partial [Dysgonomonas sp.]